jgi:hypothetical protein
MKNQKKFIKLITLFLLCNFAIGKGFAQQTDNDKIIKCIVKTVDSFFIEKDKLNEKISNSNSVHILEIVEKKVLGYNKVGIYFCSKEPSSQKYLLMKSNNTFKLIATNDLFKIIQEVLAFLKDNKVNEDKSIEYLKECINITSENMYKPFEKRLNYQEWINCE